MRKLNIISIIMSYNTFSLVANNVSKKIMRIIIVIKGVAHKDNKNHRCSHTN